MVGGQKTAPDISLITGLPLSQRQAIQFQIRFDLKSWHYVPNHNGRNPGMAPIKASYFRNPTPDYLTSEARNNKPSIKERTDDDKRKKSIPQSGLEN
jgi:hypothetical protein